MDNNTVNNINNNSSNNNNSINNNSYNNNNNINNENEDDKIRVAIRVRPLNSKEGEQKIPWVLSNNSIGLVSNNSTNFTYDYVFGMESNTIDIYNAIAKNIVKSSLFGINGTIFAYGQTSSGKTHTMCGNDQAPGIIGLSVKDIFHYIAESIHDREYLLKVSYLEIYNEEIRDLLNTKKLKLKIHEDIYRGVVVSNIREEIVSSPNQIFQLMKFGEERRHIGSTNMNDFSSRSHTIFRMNIQSTDKINGSIQMSTLTLVDLAGSERISSTGAEGVRLKEGTHINKSLMTLSTVISKLSDEKEQGKHIPYRNSKLTRILEPSIGGNSKTAIICNITPALTHQDETISTLMFARRAKKVKNKYKINEVADANTMIKKYEIEILQLRDQLGKAEEFNIKLKNTISTFNNNNNNNGDSNNNQSNILTPKHYLNQSTSSVLSGSSSSIQVINQEDSIKQLESDSDDTNTFKFGLKKFNEIIKSLEEKKEQFQKKNQKKKRRDTLDPSMFIKKQKIVVVGENSQGEELRENQVETEDADNDLFEIKPLDESTIEKIKILDEKLSSPPNTVNILKKDLNSIYEELDQNKQLISEYVETVELFESKLKEKQNENQELISIIDQWESECQQQQNQNKQLHQKDQENQIEIEKKQKLIEKIQKDTLEKEELLEEQQQLIEKMQMDNDLTISEKQQLISKMELDSEIKLLESKELLNEKDSTIEKMKANHLEQLNEKDTQFNKMYSFLQKSYEMAQQLEDKYLLNDRDQKKQLETLADSYFELETNYQNQLSLNSKSLEKIDQLNGDIENFKNLWIPVKQQVAEYFEENQAFRKYILELESKYNNLVDLYNNIENNLIINSEAVNNNNNSNSNNNQQEFEQKIESLEFSNKHLQDQLDNLLKEVNQYQQTTKSMKSQISEEKKEKQKQIHALDSEITNLKSKVISLEKINSALEGSNNQSKQVKQDLENQIELLEKELLVTKEKLGLIEQLEQIKKDNEYSIQLLKVQLEASQQETNLVKQTYNEMESTLKVAQNENQRLLQQMNDFTSTLNSIKSMFETIQQQKQTLEFEFQNRVDIWNQDSLKYKEIISKLEQFNYYTQQLYKDSINQKKQDLLDSETQYNQLSNKYNDLYSKFSQIILRTIENQIIFEQEKKESMESIQLLSSIEYALTKERDQLIKNNNQLQNQLDSIQNAKLDELRPLQLELESKKSELLKLSCQYVEQTKQVTQLLVNVDEFKSNQSKLENQLNEKNEEISALKLKSLEIAALKEENNNLNNQLNKLKKAPVKNQVDREKDLQRKELEKLKEKFNSIEGKLKQATLDKSTIQSEKQSLEKDIKDLKRSHAETEKELEKLKKTHMAADIKAKDFANLNKTVETLTKSQDALKVTVGELESELAKKKSELEKKSEEISLLTNDKEEREKRLETLCTDYEQSTIKNNNYESQITQLTTEIVQLKKKFEELSGDSKMKTDQLEKSLEEANNTISQVNKAKEELDVQLLALNNIYEDSKLKWSNESNETNEKIKILEELLQIKEKEHNQTIEQFKQLQDQFNLKTWEYNDLESQCSQLNKNISNIKQELEQNENSINSLQINSSIKIKELEAEISKLQDDHRIEVSELNRVNTQLLEKQSLLENDNIQLNERILQLLHQKSKHETEILSMESNILDLETRIKDLKSKAENLQTEFEIERNYHKGLNESNINNIKQITEELDETKKSNNQLQNKLLKVEQLNQQHQQQLQNQQQLQHQQQLQYQQQLQQIQLQHQQSQQSQQLSIEDQEEKQLLLQKIKQMEKDLEQSKLETQTEKQKTAYVAEQFKIKESEYLETITDYVTKEKEFERIKLSLKTSSNKITVLQDTIKRLQQQQENNPIVSKPVNNMLTQYPILNHNGQPIKSILKKPQSKLIIVPREQQPLTISTLNNNSNNNEQLHQSPSSPLAASSILTSSQSISKFVSKRSENNNNPTDLQSSVCFNNVPQEQNKKVRLVIKQGNNTPTNNLITTSTSIKSKSSSQINKENSNNINN